MLRTRLSIGAIAAALLMMTLACGRVPVEGSTSATASLRSDDVCAAGFTSDGLGWTLSNGTLKVSSDAGNTWRSIRLPLGSQAWKSAAVVSDQVALVATRYAKGAIVGVTSSAGGSWSVSPLLTSIGDISDDIVLAYEGTTWVAMIRFQTSSNFAAGEIFSTVCQRTRESPGGRTADLPVRGHEISRWTDSFPPGRRLAQRLHPPSRGGLGQAA